MQASAMWAEAIATARPVISFRAVTEDDLPTLGRWMDAPHWRRWWGDPADELAMIGDMVSGRDTTRPYIFSVDGVETGYIQAWFIADALVEPWLTEAPWLRVLPRETVGIDLSIGPAEKLSKGIGSATLKAFADRLAREGYETIVIDPDPANRRAIRAYEKAGFRPIRHLRDKYDDVLLMQYEPASKELNS